MEDSGGMLGGQSGTTMGGGRLVRMRSCLEAGNAKLKEQSAEQKA